MNSKPRWNLSSGLAASISTVAPIFATVAQWQRDAKDIPKLHPTQKPVNLLKQLIQLYTDPGDVVIDPCAGSGSTLRAAYELGRNAYGFEIDREMCRQAKASMLSGMGEYKPEAAAEQVTLF